MRRTYLLILFYSLLISIGTANAQTADPFPEVAAGTLPYTMSVTGYVRLNGRKLTKDDGLIVAAYHGDQILGKTTPFDPSPAYTDLIMLDVYGNTNGEAITFHVYAKDPYSQGGEEGGKLYIVDQDLTFQNNAIVGTLRQPYYIDLTDFILGDVNRDGKITVTDVMGAVSITLGNDNEAPHRFDHVAADFNSDNAVNVTDIMGIVKYLLKGQ